MRRLLLVPAILVGLVASQAWANMADEIIVLTQNDVNEDVIITFINENPRGLLKLTAADIVKLKDAGVSDRVVKALILRQSTALRAGENQAPTPPGPEQQNPQSYQPVETAAEPAAPVYNDATYYYDYPEYTTPIFYDYPVFPFGVDLFSCPWWYNCYYYGYPVCYPELGLWRHSRHYWNHFGHSILRPSHWGRRTVLAARVPATGFGQVPRRPARIGVVPTTVTFARKAGTAVASERTHAPVVSQPRVEPPVVRRTESFSGARTHSYVVSPSGSVAAPSYHHYAAPSYHSYAAPSYHFSGGGSFHGFGGGYSFGGGFHGGFGQHR